MRSKRLLLSLIAALIGGLLSGCPRNPATSPAPPSGTRASSAASAAFSQTDPWLLTTTDPGVHRGNHGIFLGNGTIGATFGATGTGDDQSALFASGWYDASEKLQPLVNGHALNLPAPKPGDPYEQTLDMKRGRLTTTFGKYNVISFVSATQPNLLVMLVRGVSGGNDVMPKASDRIGKTERVQFPGQPPRFLATAYAAVYAPGDSDIEVCAFAIGVGTSEQEAKARAHETADKASKADVATLLSDQDKAWAQRWSAADIAIEGDPEAQQLIHKLQFDLLQSVRPGGDDSIAPESLSGDFYKGHIFWDADIWMFPALLAQHPDLARNLLDYRYKHLDQARQIAKSEGFAGADYPWESAATGRETAPSGFSSERHVTAGVGWAVWQYWLATGDKAWLAARGYPVLSAVADHFASRATRNAATGKYEIKGVFGPDENKGKVDNNTYTNAMARYVLLAAGTASQTLGKPANPKWATVAKNITLPFDKAKGAYLTREQDDLAKTKQADGELVLYPAKLPMDTKTAAATFDLNAPRPIKSGPAMTASMHALMASRLGRADQTETFFRDSYRPFVRGPFVLFSEKRSLDRCVFTTGAGGVLQSVLYGFGGLDFDAWDQTAKRPIAMPKGWTKLTITGIQRAGKRYTLTVTPQKRTLQEQKP